MAEGFSDLPQQFQHDDKTGGPNDISVDAEKCSSSITIAGSSSESSLYPPTSLSAGSVVSYGTKASRNIKYHAAFVHHDDDEETASKIIKEMKEWTLKNYKKSLRLTQCYELQSSKYGGMEEACERSGKMVLFWTPNFEDDRQCLKMSKTLKAHVDNTDVSDIIVISHGFSDKRKPNKRNIAVGDISIVKYDGSDYFFETIAKRLLGADNIPSRFPQCPESTNRRTQRKKSAKKAPAISNEVNKKHPVTAVAHTDSTAKKGLTSQQSADNALPSDVLSDNACQSNPQGRPARSLRASAGLCDRPLPQGQDRDFQEASRTSPSVALPSIPAHKADNKDGNNFNESDGAKNDKTDSKDKASRTNSTVEPASVPAEDKKCGKNSKESDGAKNDEADCKDNSFTRESSAQIQSNPEQGTNREIVESNQQAVPLGQDEDPKEKDLSRQDSDTVSTKSPASTNDDGQDNESQQKGPTKETGMFKDTQRGIPGSATVTVDKISRELHIGREAPNAKTPGDSKVSTTSPCNSGGNTTKEPKTTSDSENIGVDCQRQNNLKSREHGNCESDKDEQPLVTSNTTDESQDLQNKQSLPKQDPAYAATDTKREKNPHRKQRGTEAVPEPTADEIDMAPDDDELEETLLKSPRDPQTTEEGSDKEIKQKPKHPKPGRAEVVPEVTTAKIDESTDEDFDCNETKLKSPPDLQTNEKGSNQGRKWETKHQQPRASGVVPEVTTDEIDNVADEDFDCHETQLKHVAKLQTDKEKPDQEMGKGGAKHQNLRGAAVVPVGETDIVAAEHVEPEEETQLKSPLHEEESDEEMDKETKLESLKRAEVREANADDTSDMAAEGSNQRDTRPESENDLQTDEEGTENEIEHMNPSKVTFGDDIGVFLSSPALAQGACGDDIDRILHVDSIEKLPFMDEEDNKSISQSSECNISISGQSSKTARENYLQAGHDNCPARSTLHLDGHGTDIMNSSSQPTSSAGFQVQMNSLLDGVTHDVHPRYQTTPGDQSFKPLQGPLSSRSEYAATGGEIQTYKGPIQESQPPGNVEFAYESAPKNIQYSPNVVTQSTMTSHPSSPTDKTPNTVVINIGRSDIVEIGLDHKKTVVHRQLSGANGSDAQSGTADGAFVGPVSSRSSSSLDITPARIEATKNTLRDMTDLSTDSEKIRSRGPSMKSRMLGFLYCGRRKHKKQKNANGKNSSEPTSFGSTSCIHTYIVEASGSRAITLG